MNTELDAFMASVSSLQNSSSASSFSSLVRSSLTLLHQNPLTFRDAVLAFLSNLIDASLEFHFKHGGSDNKKQGQAWNDLLDQVQADINLLVKENPDGWSNVFANWCLSVLGEMSSKYASRLGNPSSALGLDLGLSKWLECKAMTMLIEITSTCLSSLTHNPDVTESCISVLLDTSVKHAPKFDWVVAQVGGAFPETVIDRVLTVGLKDFCQSAQIQVDKDQDFTLSRVSKFNSVVGILGHLASTHSKQITDSLRTMILKSLDTSPKSMSDMQIGVIPFALYLSTMSEVLRSTLSHTYCDVLENDHRVERLADLHELWQEKYFNDAEDALMNISVHLIVLCSNFGSNIIHHLLNFTFEDYDYSKTVRNGAKMLIELILADLQSQNHHTTQFNSEEVPLMKSLKQNYQFLLTKFFLSEDVFHRRCSLYFLNYLSIKKSRPIAVNVVKYALMNSENETDLGVMMEFIRETELFVTDFVKIAIAQILKLDDLCTKEFLSNLIFILQYQQKPPDEQKIRVLTSFSEAIRENHMSFMMNFGDKEFIPCILDIFELVPLSQDADTSLIFRCSHFFVHGIFLILEEKEYSEEERVKLIKSCVKTLVHVSNTPIGLPMTLRFIIEGSISSRFARDLFGSKVCTIREDSFNAKITTNKTSFRLLDENKKFGSMPIKSLGTSTVFHAGVIGNGKTPLRSLPRLHPDTLEFNQFSLLCILSKICNSGSKERSKEAYKQLTLLLIELVSPDVMYNGLPWPDEEFMKVTIERDLTIAKTFEDHPILWKILMNIAEARPALCYCSVLIRALLAVQLNYWQGCVMSKAANSPKQLQQTKTVLELMSVGQFLPHPLNAVSDVIHVFHSFHVHCILIDIWNYMKDNVPSPIAFASNSDGIVARDFEPYKNYKTYCERLRLIMINHIDILSMDFKRFFIDVSQKTEEDLKIAMEY